MIKRLNEGIIKGRSIRLGQLVIGVAAASSLTIALLSFGTYRVLQSAAISEVLASAFGGHMLQVIENLDNFDEADVISGSFEGFTWRLQTESVFTSAAHQNWNETVISLSSGQADERLARVILKNTALDAAEFEGRQLLLKHLSSLSARIASLRSDAILRIQLTNGNWVEFSSERHWRTRITNVQIGLIWSVVLAALILSLTAIAGGLKSRFQVIVDYAQSLLAQQKPNAIEMTAITEAIDLVAALNLINQNFAHQITERTRFLAAISHDLRTPATRMQLRAEMIDDDTLREKLLSDLDEILEMVNAAVGFLKDGVEQGKTDKILFVTLMQSICDDYIDTGKAVTLNLPVPLSVSTTGTLFDPRQRNFDIDLDRQITLVCQPSRLRRAFNNIIDNALKYGGWARIDISADADEIVVRIIDGGDGIATEQHALVFEPFYRVEGSRNRATGGVGLGLAVAKSVVEDHNGSVQLFNHHRHGLEVRVSLPRTS